MNSRLGRRLVLVGITIGSVVLASCSTASTPPTSGTLSTTTKPYGSLTIAANFASGSFIPKYSSGGTYEALSSAVFDSLVELDVGNREVPAIAERWEIAPDGMSQTFYIRKGVKFHDGSDLTGADVKFSLEMMIAPEATHNRSAEWRNAVKSVELKDDYTVVLHMKAPQFEFVSETSSGITAVMPKKYIEEKGEDFFSKNPIGSGPWKFVSFTPGVRLEIEAVESHWRAVPKFNNLTVLAVPEESAKVAMLKTGELDLAEVAVDSVAGLKAAGLPIVHYEGGTTYYSWVFYDISHPEQYALGDVRVRKAVQLAVNQQEIADKILGGYGRPGTKTVETGAFRDAKDPLIVKPFPYAPEEAKKLLAEAGYPNGFDTTFFDPGQGGQISTMAQALAGYALKIGVKGKIVAGEYSALRTMFTPKQKPEIWNSIFTYRSASRPGFSQLDSTYHSTFSSIKNTNNAKLDALIEKIPMTKDPAERRRIGVEALVMGANEHTTTILGQVDRVLAHSAKIGDFVHYPTPEVFTNVYETITHAK
ncbi:MAG: ABC transporter substrate-binding protein [Dehalococcoidia bacterium]|nr:ABC transporter substrate-binding protein [Dehalococcoidia bacterium]